MTSAFNNVVGSDGQVHNSGISAVYILENPESGDFYIGATSNLKIRQQKHLRELRKQKHCNPGLQRNYNEAGDLVVVAVPVPDSKTAFQIEKRLIEQNRDNHHCLNVKDSTWSPTLGKTWTEEQKAKHSETITRAYVNGTKQAPWTGKQRDPETVEKVSASNKRIYENGYVNPFTGKTHSEAFKLEQSERASQMWSKPGFKDTAIQRFKQQRQDPDHVERHSKATRDAMSRPEVREKICTPVQISGVTYSSVKEAIGSLGISQTEFYRRKRKGVYDVQ